MSTAEKVGADSSIPADGTAGAECCMVRDGRADCKLAALCRDAGKSVLAQTVEFIVHARHGHGSEVPVRMRPSEVFAQMPDDTTVAVRTKRTSDAVRLLTQLDGFDATGASHGRRYVVDPDVFATSCLARRVELAESLSPDKLPKSLEVRREQLSTSYAQIESDSELELSIASALLVDTGLEQCMGSLKALLDKATDTISPRQIYVSGKRAIKTIINRSDYPYSRALFERVHELSELLKSVFYYELPTTDFSIKREDTAWFDTAACYGLDSSIFFPEDGTGVRQAQEICAGCPDATRSDCLEYAITHKIENGVWGGTSERERRRLVRQRQLEVSQASD